MVGGGCVGAGIAWEAATRGLSVGLVERDDFASGTSSRSTKLIHGGIRYLEAAFFKADIGMFKLVMEALGERAHLLNAAPFMTRALPILLPVYSWWEAPYMYAGAKVYDVVARIAGGGDLVVPSSRFLTAEEAVFAFPMLKKEGLKGAVVYYDGMHNDARMNVLIALTAAQAGAAVANYVGVSSIVHDATGRAVGAVAVDKLTGESITLRAKTVVNATGPFGDGLRLMDDPTAVPLITGSAGVHLVLPDHFSPDGMGLIVPKTADGRVLFFLPWEGSTLVGTTDDAAPISATPGATLGDVDYLLSEASRLLNRTITKADVKSAWSGIRPLVKDPRTVGAGATSAISRAHVVEVNPRTGLVSVLGGKWTTYRRMAEDAVDAIAAAAPPGTMPFPQPSVTLRAQVLGADRAGVVVNRKYDRIPVTLRETYQFDKEVAQHLARSYGTRALLVADKAVANPALRRRLHAQHPVIGAEVVFAVEQEFAVHAVDVIARRTRLAILDASAAKESVAAVVDIMAPVLGWNSKQRADEMKAGMEYITTQCMASGRR